MEHKRKKAPESGGYVPYIMCVVRWLREAATTITCDLLTAIFLSTPNPTRGEWLLKMAAFIPSYSERQREYRLLRYAYTLQ